MKFLSVLFLASVGLSLAAKPPKFDESAFFDYCTDECNFTEQDLIRLKKWEFQDQPTDRCSINCGWHEAKQVLPDGSIDVDAIVKQFESRGIEVPSEVYEYKDAGADKDKVFEISLRFLENREAIKKAYFFAAQA